MSNRQNRPHIIGRTTRASKSSVVYGVQIERDGVIVRFTVDLLVLDSSLSANLIISSIEVGISHR